MVHWPDTHPTWHAQAREALKSASKEKSSALAAALEARDAARTKALVVEENAARAKEDLERELAAAGRKVSAAEVSMCLKAAEESRTDRSFAFQKVNMQSDYS